ncbi:MAG: MlaC/ttg2D family ABC transporter substrate-binding protein [Pseudohongiellaceae bacterium]
MKRISIVNGALKVIALVAVLVGGSAWQGSGVSGVSGVLGYGMQVDAQVLSAEETAKLGVDTLLQAVEEYKELYETDRDAYFERIEEVLSSFVDFNMVVGVVMNRYGGQASDEQKERFAGILKSTLTRFYGASLLSYEGQDLEFLPSSDSGDDPRGDKIVTMVLRGDGELRLQYQMFINENDEWKLKNLSLAGINLGRQYFTQFAALMAQHNNDIDAVLDNWQ